MKKQFFYLLTALCLAVTFSSCEKTDDPDPKTNDAAFTDYNKEQLNQDIFADDTETEGGFAFTAKEAWRIDIDEATKSTVEDSWVEVSPMSGVAGAHTITIKLDLNYTGEDREVEIKINAGESVITITVKQKGKTEAGVAPTPKVITSLSGVWGTDYPCEYQFKYDANWQLTSVVEKTAEYEKEAINITYENNKISVLEYSIYDDGDIAVEDRMIYNLENNVIVSSTETSIGVGETGYESSSSHTYNYNSDGYLQKSTEIRTYSDDAIKHTIVREPIWTNGNITSVTMTRKPLDGEGNNINIETISYTEYKNKTNLDITSILCHTESLWYAYGGSGGIPWITRKVGKTNANLIAEEVIIWYNQHSGVQKDVCTYTYKFDADGDPTEIKMVIKKTYRPDYTGEKTEDDETRIILITYNK